MAEFSNTTLNAIQLSGEYAVENYPGYARYLTQHLKEIRQVVRKNLVDAKYRSKRYYDKRAHPQNIRVGDAIYLKKMARKNKLEHFYDKGYTVVDVIDKNNVVTTKLNERTEIVHKDRVKLDRKP